MSTLEFARDMARLDFESYLERRYDSAITHGITTQPERMERARKLILEKGLADETIVTQSGRESTVKEFFERVYQTSFHVEHENGDGV